MNLLILTIALSAFLITIGLLTLYMGLISVRDVLVDISEVQKEAVENDRCPF